MGNKFKTTLKKDVKNIYIMIYIHKVAQWFPGFSCKTVLPRCYIKDVEVIK